MLMIALSLVVGLSGVVGTVFLIRDTLRWRKHRLTNPESKFSEWLARSRWQMIMPLMFAALGLFGAGQLTGEFTVWPRTSSEWGALFLAGLYVVSGPVGVIVQNRQAKRLEEEKEPLSDERDQMISLHVGRTIGATMFAVLAVRGTIDLLVQGDALLTRSVFYFMVTNPFYQTILIGLAAAHPIQLYYRNRQI